MSQTDLAPQNGESFQQRLRKARDEQLHEHEPIRVPIPGCECTWQTDDGKTHEGHLVARYRPLGYEAVREITGASTGPQDALKEKTAAAALLIAACDGVEAVEDGNPTDLGVKMGRSLAEYLGADLDGFDGDVQALLAMFPDEHDLKLMVHHGEVVQKMGLVDERVLEDLLGNSAAARE